MPVSRSTELSSALPKALPEQQADFAEEEADFAAPQRQRRDGFAQGDEERRLGDRRKENHPILLDTRMTRSRRESAEFPVIHFEI